MMSRKPGTVEVRQQGFNFAGQTPTIDIRRLGLITLAEDHVVEPCIYQSPARMPVEVASTPALSQGFRAC